MVNHLDLLTEPGRDRANYAAGLMLLVAVFALLMQQAAHAAPASVPTAASTLQNAPPWALAVIRNQAFIATFTVLERLTPSFLQGDFNGDGQRDVVFLIQRNTTGQQGLAFLHGGSQKAIVIGAGRALGNGGADFDWLDAWGTQPRVRAVRGQPASKLAATPGDAVLVEKQESASGWIY